MKRSVLFFLLLISFSGYSQTTINNYKYVLVPEKFSFLKEVNQYGLNTLTKALLEEKGFTVYFDNTQLPAEIATNKCRALNFELLQRKSMFTTNLTLLLKDCQGNVIFKGKEGKSREKEFETSYNEALREAFKSLNEVQYVYSEIPAPPAVATPVAVPATAAVNEPVSSTATAVPAAQVTGTLYAQPTANGYQLIDTAPKIVLTLLKTSVPDYFIAGNGAAQGIVLKKNENWFFEYYQNDKLVSEKLAIKF
ncbi:hypothetical protein [Pedobacter heparinus]|uniref:Beta-lactamase-inhibitor-like PepSY-like domain-containing protein n=1 Tax=Pedobacter heparinus (strain ATCC 13125 / DSM 2366 / CIP 104194 / JCM 7457 / NBRC 12017 / NCIMB 9290 / NRRL B-14731 / HIM 762-3) TaxID=485917 RepID=C6XS54_PEDHD|nr:hypothetical protein [Pedobacter heparinus]ACU03399.1 hypothetical protein Phep_1181 [Pedobacter heparinus DSM 2366]